MALLGDDNKEFNDPVHGFVELNRTLLSIIDTPQFQRLRYVKQLGLAYFVYPGAVHTRFEHCIGVCHLAGLLARRLRELQPELEITSQDVLCVEIAALCHDLGHGPFSHSFEMFMEKVRPDRHWAHEDASTEMLDFLIKENVRVQEEFAKAELTGQDIVFIKELIGGVRTKACGRSKKKAFLFNIVANKENGIDVDKFDYFARDCHHSGLHYGFDHLRVLKNTKVLFTADGASHICFRDKIVNDLGDMFQFRYLLHRREYQHRTTRLLEFMMTEVMIKAEKHLTFRGKDGKKLHLSECVDDMIAYGQLRDSIIDIIRWADDDGLNDAKATLDAIERRELYCRVGEVELDSDDAEKELHKFIVDKLQLQSDAVIVIPIKFNFGHGIRNPLENVLFYEKNSSIPQQLTASKGAILSRFNAERYTYRKSNIYLKKRGDQALFQSVLDAFNEWCLSKSARAKTNDLDFTPFKGAIEGVSALSPNMSPPETVKRPPTNHNDAKCRRILDQ